MNIRAAITGVATGLAAVGVSIFLGAMLFAPSTGSATVPPTPKFICSTLATGETYCATPKGSPTQHKVPKGTSTNPGRVPTWSPTPEPTEKPKIPRGPVKPVPTKTPPLPGGCS